MSWLKEQMAIVEVDIQEWPAWMKRECGMKERCTKMQYTSDPAKKLKQLEYLSYGIRVLTRLRDELLSSHCPSSGSPHQLDGMVKMLQDLE